MDMEQLLEWMEIIEDNRQHRKVRHNIKDILIHCTLCHTCQRRHMGTDCRFCLVE